MTNTEIIKAAFKVWGREFYRNTSLSQLAQELGVSKAAIYRHFKDKQALLDAMTGLFFDELAGFIQPSYQHVIHNPKGGIFGIFTAIMEFCARNVYAFIFFLTSVYDREAGGCSVTEQLSRRGIDLKILHRVIKAKYSISLRKAQEHSTEPLLMHLIFATLTFFMAHFHKTGKSFDKTPSEARIKKAIAQISENISSGLKLPAKKVDELDYAALETRINQTIGGIPDSPLLKAVAQAVAQAGPWEASMDMVARRIGLCKSSLYCHFKSKQDMLYQLFKTEYEQMLAFTKQGIVLSSNSTEQLYLGIYSIAVYLRSKPEILAAMDWIRTRKLDFGRPERKPEHFNLFEGIKSGPLKKQEEAIAEKERSIKTHWIQFLIINALMQCGTKRELQNDDIRTLFRYLTLGIKGFMKE